MIPKFPSFKRLEMADREEVEGYARRFPPYSDFSLVSLVSWDVDGSCELSQVNGSLVVSFPDYSTREPLLSFLGDHKTGQTATTLLDYA